MATRKDSAWPLHLDFTLVICVLVTPSSWLVSTSSSSVVRSTSKHEVHRTPACCKHKTLYTAGHTESYQKPQCLRSDLQAPSSGLDLCPCRTAWLWNWDHSKIYSMREPSTIQVCFFNSYSISSSSCLGTVTEEWMSTQQANLCHPSITTMK